MEMKEVYVYHHLGLGDHIMLNGLVRVFAENFEKLYLFVKHHNIGTVKNMFADLNLEIIPVTTDHDVVNYVISRKITNLIKVGFEYLAQHKELNFEEAFYHQYNVPFSYRWDKFKIVRDLESEEKVFNHYDVKPNEYVLVHEDPSRGFLLNPADYTKSGLPVVKPIRELTENMCNYAKLILNAKEIHCIDSSFKTLVDSLDINHNNLYHYYLPHKDWHFSLSRLKWNIIGR